MPEQPQHQPPQPQHQPPQPQRSERGGAPPQANAESATGADPRSVAANQQRGGGGVPPMDPRNAATAPAAEPRAAAPAERKPMNKPSGYAAAAGETI